MDHNFFTNQFPSPEKIRDDVTRKGFEVYHNVIHPDVYQKLRDYWLNYFTTSNEARNFVRGGMYLGEKNFNSFSKNHHWNLYRYFDFLWNEPPHDISREIAVAIHRERNQAQGFDPEYGLRYDPSGYSVYVSVSYYPPDGGFFEDHEDGYSDHPLLHYMLPITFQGEDYKAGGLIAFTKDGEKVDVDAEMKPGSLLFFDGRQRHGVEPIVPYEEKPLGRLALFAIPAFFKKAVETPVAIRDIKNRLLWTAEGIALPAIQRARQFLGR